MTPIDLIDYTDSDEKIPSELLSHARSSEEVPLAKILSAYAVDGAVLLTGTSFVCFLVDLSMLQLLPTRALTASYEAIDYSIFLLTLAPLICVSYFFLSYLLNGGQSYGKKTQDIRLSLLPGSFRAALVWGAFSGLATLSFGLSAIGYGWITGLGLGQFQNHDQLYVDLMSAEGQAPVELQTAEVVHELVHVVQRAA